VTQYVGFLRAVNVGKRRVSMSRVVEICTDLGYTDVWTMANSGNVAFTATGSRSAVEQRLSDAFQDAFGFEVTTFVRTAAELRTVVQGQPFALGDGDTYFVTFLHSPPSATATNELEAHSNDFDTLHVVGRDVHWRMHGKSTETTVKSKAWKSVGDHSTSRNITMLRKIVAKLDG
jgi:uncharacterized protein (DUF1697 family)